MAQKKHPSTASPSVSVCFPAYNEEVTVGEVIQEAHDLLSRSGLVHEIVVCDDGSTDRTGPIVDDMCKRLPRLRVLHHAENRGIHDTFEHLYLEASHEFVFLNSVDQQWKTSILFDMLPLTRNWDVIVASRIDKHYTWFRRFVSWAYNAIPVVLFGVRAFDAGAVKLMRREIIHRFTLVSHSPFSEAERLIRAAYAGYRITEYPVEVATRRTGRARGVNAHVLVQSLLDVPRVWWALKAGRQSVGRQANS
ncbi:MAG: glycosyltransferase family 2 protein [Acidimicrobiia bacterium]